MGPKKFFKIDLHCHLDGGLPLDTVRNLIEEQRDLFRWSELEDFGTTDGLRSELVAPRECGSLEEYLKCFSLPIKLLQIPKAMWIAGKGIAEELKCQDIRYAEVRFAPQLHSKYAIGDKFSYEEEMLKELLAGINFATRFSHTKINVILCLMRNLTDGDDGIEANLRTLFLAKKFLGKGVVGIDLAGDEARDPTSKFKCFFEVAREQGIPFTIHAGEAGDDLWRIDSIEQAISFGASRIGHGVGLEKSKELRRIVRELGIVVECCPSSNLHTKSVGGGISNHPIKMFLDEGIKVTINTDNMMVSDTSLDDEYRLVKEIGLTDKDILVMQKNAIDGAFITEGEKKRLKRRLRI